jgi:inosine-uridine nucleoside N-ribohydrolase
MRRYLWLGWFLILPLAISTCGPGPQPATTPALIPADVPTATANPSTASLTEAPVTAPTLPAHRMPVIYDDDGSPDGTAALFYLLSDPEVSVEGIGISFGEAHPAVYIQHIARELDYLGVSDIPLGAGRGAPLAGSNEFPEWLREISDEFWGLPVPNLQKTFPVHDAAESMVSLLNHAPEPVTIFVSGPCTNLAQALRLDPAIKDHIAAVVIMGGAVHVPGNLVNLQPDSGNTVAEWNIYADPQAAAEVFESGLDVYLVPLDATDEITVGRQDTEQWRLGGATAGFAADVYEMLFEAWGTEAAAAWDLVTAAIMVHPELCAFQPLYLEVVTGDGSSSGQTAIVLDEEPNVQACLEPDGDRIKQTLNAVFSRSQ